MTLPFHEVPMTPAEAEPYLHCFEREYWTCDLPKQPADGQRATFGARHATFSGAWVIDEVATANDGLLIPLQHSVCSKGALPADAFGQGTVVKVVTEGLFVRDREGEVSIDFPLGEHQDDAYVMRSTPEYFGIDHITPDEVRSYQQTSDWLVAAGNRSVTSNQSWFPFEVDYEQSIDAGPYTDVMNRVRVEGVHTNAGLPAIDIGITAPVEPLGYKRAIRAVLHRPLIVPDTAGSIPRRGRF